MIRGGRKRYKIREADTLSFSDDTRETSMFGVHPGHTNAPRGTTTEI